MKASDLPTRFNIPWANGAGGAYIRPIPEASQIGIQNGAASLTDGFPPLTFTPVNAGGVPPFGSDSNGILNQITSWSRWQGAGGPVVFDSDFSDAVGGYPKGATVFSVSVPGMSWLSTADDNGTDPDSNAAANWTPFVRARLTANTDFYVNGGTGSDVNGLGTSSSPWATQQHAIDVLMRCYDFNGPYIATVNVADGSYSAGVEAVGAFVGATRSIPVEIKGNVANPSAVLVTDAVSNGYIAQANAGLRIRGITLSAPAAGRVGIGTSHGGRITYESMIFAACGAAHAAATLGGVTTALADNTLIAGSAIHAFASQGATMSLANSAIVINTSSLTFSTAFVQADHNGSLLAGACNITGTGLGTVTGKRFRGVLLGTIDTDTGGNVNFFPGSVAGTADAGAYN